MTYQPTTTDNLAADIARLFADLADMGLTKHNAAIAHGLDTLVGQKLQSQSHAYTNAAMWLQMILDAHAK